MTQTMYLRFGDLPATGYSWNAERDEPEAGVSVYRAEWQSSDRDVVCIEVRSDAEIAAAGMLDLFDRPAYIVTGEMVGRGGDGEPLLTNCHAEPVGVIEIVNHIIEEE